MRFTKAFITTRRDAPADAEVISHQLMVRAGMINKLASGIYSYLPLGLKVIQKVEQIIREEMNAAGAQEVLLPILMPADLWKETGRWEVYGKELLRVKDRKDNDFCFGPTHEEAITDLVRKTINSYRQLPVSLYQIQTKFRDEIRPRFGLMRGREFIMKDCYSFDVSEEESMKTYRRMFEAYRNIFSRCGLECRPVEAGTGAIGGTVSHEFHVLASSGEDEIFACGSCEFAASTEKVPDDKKCPQCLTPLKSYRGIEVGQVFYLGDKYSKAMKAVFLDETGNEKTAIMGCYGIGVGRTAAAAIEQNHDDHGIVWPQGIAPYQATLLSLNMDNSDVAQKSENIYSQLCDKGIDLLWDDRYESSGVKFKDADLIGIPVQIIVGARGLKEGCVELKNRQSQESEQVPLAQFEEAVLGRLTL